jgi:hypothetical protein
MGSEDEDAYNNNVNRDQEDDVNRNVTIDSSAFLMPAFADNEIMDLTPDSERGEFFSFSSIPTTVSENVDWSLLDPQFQPSDNAMSVIPDRKLPNTLPTHNLPSVNPIRNEPSSTLVHRVADVVSSRAPSNTSSTEKKSPPKAYSIEEDTEFLNHELTGLPRYVPPTQHIKAIAPQMNPLNQYLLKFNIHTTRSTKRRANENNSNNNNNNNNDNNSNNNNDNNSNRNPLSATIKPPILKKGRKRKQ